MGIPSYFSWLVRHFQSHIIANQPPFAPIHHLYLDFNCAIHPVARAHSHLDIPHMCDQVIRYLDYLIHFVHPTQLVFIAIDGVAPVAKMKQQRLRRFKSVQETQVINQLKQQWGQSIDPHPKDFNMISPATEFMSILSRKIQDYMRQPHPFQMILSDATIPSEGEHKILQYLKTQPSETNCVIYGLDSDLIMLSMCANRPNLVLVRENILAHDNVNFTEKYPSLNYFLINQLKQILLTVLTTGNLHPSILLEPPTDTDSSEVIRDYIFMSFFLGNDFLPPFLTLKIRNGGIEKIIQTYHIVHGTSSGSRHFFQEDNLNHLFLIDFIRVLAQQEESNLYRIADEHHRYLVSSQSNTSPQSFEEALEQYQKIEEPMVDEIDVYRTGWQERYYQYFFHIGLGQTHQTRNSIRQVCHQYLTTLQWNTQYYFQQCQDWHWMYPYEATPLLIDFLEFLENSPQPMKPSLQPHHPVSPYHQLLMILPPQSANLLPKPYQPFMISDRSPLIHYFPLQFENEKYGHRFRWETHPKIPFLNPIEVDSYLRTVEDLLTDEEQQRAQVSQLVITTGGNW